MELIERMKKLLVTGATGYISGRYHGEKENPLARTLLDKLETEVAIILKPVNYFGWDYSSWMKKISPAMLELTEKSCP